MLETLRHPAQTMSQFIKAQCQFVLESRAKEAQFCRTWVRELGQGQETRLPIGRLGKLEGEFANWGIGRIGTWPKTTAKASPPTSGGIEGSRPPPTSRPPTLPRGAGFWSGMPAAG